MKAKQKTNSDKIEREILLKSAKIATKRAKKISIALGLSIKSISNGQMIETLPNGETKVLKTIKKSKSYKPSIKKGTVLCLK
jgi:hypothetical protein